MNRLAVPKASVPILLAAWVGGASPAQAGDPIILPADLGKLPPVPEAASTKPALKPTERLPKVSPLNIEGLSLPTPAGRRRKTEEEKRRQAARDERRNWLLLRPGELTDKASDERTFGVRLDKWLAEEQEVERQDYTFYGLDRPKPNSEAEAKPGQSRPTTAQNPAPAARPVEPQEKDKPRSSTGSPLLLYEQARPGQGAHTAKELDFRSYFDTTIVDLQSGRPSHMDGMLGTGLQQGRPRQAQARLDEFTELLNGPKGPGLMGQSVSPAKPPVELARPPVTSTRPLPDSGLGLSGAGALTAPADLGAAGWAREPGLPSLPDLNSGRFSAPSRLPTAPPGREPTAGSPISRPSVLRPTVLEIPSLR